MKVFWEERYSEAERMRVEKVLVELNEGRYHKGKSAVVRVLLRRPV